MSVPVVVPDASVLLKWVLPSEEKPDADEALTLRSAILDSTVYALVPPLWIYEVGNTVARRFPDLASAWLSAPTASQDIAIDAATQCHALRCVLSRPGHRERRCFVTADSRYVTKTKSSGSVIALSDWQPPADPPPPRGKRK